MRRTHGADLREREPDVGHADGDVAGAGAGEVRSRRLEPLHTEFAFELPRGYVDGSGTVHRHGVMRLATARDEIEPLRDAAVRQNEVYLAVLLLARTVIRIGDVTAITPELIEGLYASDFDHLQRLYERLNSDGEAVGTVTCPSCKQAFEVDLSDVEDGRLGES